VQCVPRQEPWNKDINPHRLKYTYGGNSRKSFPCRILICGRAVFRGCRLRKFHLFFELALLAIDRIASNTLTRHCYRIV